MTRDRTLEISRGNLNTASRERSVAALKNEVLDVLVIGGGVTGAGVALDTATRGLRVGLVEARDFASGTSSQSSKLIHGGLRYLEQLNFRLVREALVERGTLLTTVAPHLVTPVPFLFPLRHKIWERIYVGSGIALYDTLAHASRDGGNLPWHRHLSRRRALSRFPGLRNDALVGAVLYYDAQVDDARFTVTLARTAAAHGAHVVTRMALVDFVRDGPDVVGARVRDLESTQEEFVVRATRTIGAVGIWTDDVQAMVTNNAPIKIRTSKGIHLVVPRACIEGDDGLILRTEKSVLFVIPWKQNWIVGTTDTEWTLNKEYPSATRSDIDYVLERANSVLRTPLRITDVEGVYVGLRPLVDVGAASTNKLNREHVVVQPTPGLTMVTGGKYTTYRVMAKDAVDVALHDVRVSHSVTHQTPLLGAVGYRASAAHVAEGAAKFGIDENRVRGLLNRYGDEFERVLAAVAKRPDLLRPLEGAPMYLRAEVVFAIEAEMALHLDDLLIRRTRIHFETSDRGLGAATEAATIMGESLGWDERRTAHEINRYVAMIGAERVAQSLVDEVAADAVMGEFLDRDAE